MITEATIRFFLENFSMQNEITTEVDGITELSTTFLKDGASLREGIILTIPIALKIQGGITFINAEQHMKMQKRKTMEKQNMTRTPLTLRIPDRITLAITFINTEQSMKMQKGRTMEKQNMIAISITLKTQYRITLAITFINAEQSIKTQKGKIMVIEGMKMT